MRGLISSHWEFSQNRERKDFLRKDENEIWAQESAGFLYAFGLTSFSSLYTTLVTDIVDIFFISLQCVTDERTFFMWAVLVVFVIPVLMFS